MSNYSILVAEDEDDVRDVLVRILEFSGFEVVSVSDGQQAVDAAAAWSPDLILLDVRMPVLSGFEACEIFKSQAATKDIPVIFLSAKGQESEINYGLELGAVEYLVKPFELMELVVIVKRVLNEYSKN